MRCHTNFENLNMPAQVGSYENGAPQRLLLYQSRDTGSWLMWYTSRRRYRQSPALQLQVLGSDPALVTQVFHLSGVVELALVLSWKN